MYKNVQSPNPGQCHLLSDTSMSNNMPAVYQLPDADRRQTRPANANTHPGKVIKDAQKVRRSKEVIAEEKKGREDRRQTREKKKADRMTAVGDIAEFENKLALDAIAEKTQFPRGMCSSMCSWTCYIVQPCTL